MAWKLKRTKSGDDEPKTKGLKPSDDGDSDEQFEHKPGAFEPVSNEYDPEYNNQDRTVMLLNDEDFLPGLIPSLSNGAAAAPPEHEEAAASNGAKDEHDDFLTSAMSSADDAVSLLHAAKQDDLDLSPVDEHEGMEEGDAFDLDAFAPYAPGANGDSAEAPAIAVGPSVADAAPAPVLDSLAAPVTASKLVVRLGQFSASYEVVKSEVTIGRPDPRMDVFPDVAIEWDDAVSRNHARVLHRGDGDYVEDTGSTNGTKLNDAPLVPNKPMVLKDGDRIQLGEKTQITYVR